MYYEGCKLSIGDIGINYDLASTIAFHSFYVITDKAYNLSSNAKKLLETTSKVLVINFSDRAPYLEKNR